VGDIVKAGDLLAELQNPDSAPAASAARQQWLAAQASLVQAEANAERFVQMLSKQAVTQQEFEAARQSLDSARAQEQAAKANAQGFEQLLKELQLRAPFDGVITADHFDIGDVVQAGQSVMELIDPSSVEAEVTISPAFIERINLGDKVELQGSLKRTSTSVLGQVIHKSPFTSLGSLPMVVVKLPAQDIRPGTAVELEFTLQAQLQLRIPLRALFRISNDQTALYKIVDNVAQLTIVAPLRISGDSVIIEQDSASIANGDLVAIEGVNKLYDGALVEVLQ
jgi:RND family efflux transporter MFP subunit